MSTDTKLQEEISRIYKNAQNRILLYAQAFLPDDQYQAFRQLILYELGTRGAEGKVKKLFREKSRHENEDIKEFLKANIAKVINENPLKDPEVLAVYLKRTKEEIQELISKGFPSSQFKELLDILNKMEKELISDINQELRIRGLRLFKAANKKVKV